MHFVVPDSDGLRESQADILTRYAIDPATLTSSSSHLTVRNMGYSPKSGKWYGWSHRAVYGFPTKAEAAAFAEEVG